MTQLTSELLSIDYTKATALVIATKLTSQINLVGTILKLPEMIKEFKTAEELLTARQEKLNTYMYDPLNKE